MALCPDPPMAIIRIKNIDIIHLDGILARVTKVESAYWHDLRRFGGMGRNGEQQRKQGG